MITWMQKHKKYLIITIWISTIAFIGAGFVGWGQYNYSNKAGVVAEVGNIEISRGELQKSYSRLYAKYNEIFRGNFDEEKANAFGLKRQALKQLTDEALLLNLANYYDLAVSDKELLNKLTTQEIFFDKGVFNKNIYKQLLSRNNMTMAEYETDLRKQLLISKLLALVPVKIEKNERDILKIVVSIADKVEYKVLTDREITVDTSDKLLKPFWEKKKNNYTTEKSYEIKYFKQKTINNEYTDIKISNYYNDNKTHFKDLDGKIISLEKSRDKVISELNEKATKEMALRNYIAYKKEKLESNIKLKDLNISLSNNQFNSELLEKVSKTSITSPYLKPIKVENSYYIVKLIQTLPSKIKSFEDAKDELLPLYINEIKREKLLDLANSTLSTFKGETTDFLTKQDTKAIKELRFNDSKEFLEKLFNLDKKNSFIELSSGKIVLYKIIEQKFIDSKQEIDTGKMEDLKNSIFNVKLLENLNNRYNTKILVEGL